MRCDLYHRIQPFSKNVASLNIRLKIFKIHTIIGNFLNRFGLQLINYETAKDGRCCNPCNDQYVFKSRKFIMDANDDPSMMENN